MMQERPEDEAYEAMPDNGEAYLKEALAQLRQIQTNTRRIIEGGAWFAAIGFLLLVVLMLDIKSVF